MSLLLPEALNVSAYFVPALRTETVATRNSDIGGVFGIIPASAAVTYDTSIRGFGYIPVVWATKYVNAILVIIDAQLNT
jgi:hypothetical protein